MQSLVRMKPLYEKTVVIRPYPVYGGDYFRLARDSTRIRTCRSLRVSTFISFAPKLHA
jgi:hypothetical protein